MKARKQKDVPPRQPKAENQRPWLWIGLSSIAALFLVFEVYGPALHGGFILDDRYLPIFNPEATGRIRYWVGIIRPLLGLSYWIDYEIHGQDAFGFRVTNVLLHFVVAALVALIAAKLLEWTGAPARTRIALAGFSGAVFLLHPLQTESVSYLASRSEILSMLFFYGAFAVYLYRRGEGMSIGRTIGVLVLFAAALASKEHTLILPVWLVLADFLWSRGGFRAHRILYSLLAFGVAIGAVFIWKILSTANTAGFRLRDMTPAAFFFTQCRVLWTYIRMFFVPMGQNIDPDVAVSNSALDHGAIFGLIALLALVVLAWIYRKQFPLASFGVFTFLLLIAPTSSIVPLKDVLAEHRVYMPFIGLIFVCLEFLRRLNFPQIVWATAAAIAACSMLTYQRNQLWGSPLLLWQDSVEKSPQKYRPRFQLAYAQYEEGQCADAAKSYEIAAKLQPPDTRLLVDWALALDCAGDPDRAIEELRRAQLRENTAHIHTQIAMVLAKRGKMPDALDELAQAERLDASYPMIYVYRGNIYESSGNRAAAVHEYEHAIRLNPKNQAAHEALARVGAVK